MEITQIKQELDDKGYVVIPNILTSDEIDLYSQEFHKWRNSIENLDTIHKRINPHFIYKFHQIGHQDMHG